MCEDAGFPCFLTLNLLFSMNLSSFFKKKSSETSNEEIKPLILKVNPYENPENVMELMSKICSAKPSIDTDVYWNIVRDAYNKEVRGKSLNQYLDENRKNLLNPDFAHNIDDYCRRLSWSMSEYENTEHTQIVVAGGFSAGKSSFLNRLTNSANLLPTGVEPVSVVKTYLYCSNKAQSVSVKGVNLKNVLVNLNTSVLQAIQHAKKSNVFLASVLEKLFVEIPSKELDGIVFIDTPGYNNTDKANESNGKSDRETAVEALGEGNVLFWLIDCERGTTATADLEMIKQFQGKKVIIFNKADKKGESECKKIVKQAEETIYNEFPKEEIIDIIAFSTLENKIYYSANKKTLSSIVSEAKQSGNGISEMKELKNLIEELFDNEIEASKTTIKNAEQDYIKAVDEKNEWENEYRKINHNDDEYITSVVRQVLVNSYTEVLNAADKITSASLNSLNQFNKFVSDVECWDATDHNVFNNTLTPILQRGERQYNSCAQQHNNAIKYQYYEEEYRKDLAQRIQKYFADRFKEIYDDKCNECNNLLERKKVEEILIKDFTDYKKIFMAALDLGIKQYLKQSKATRLEKDELENLNVFDCIRKDDYKAFMRSFEYGVDLTICDSDGYTPLTLSVMMGNNSMVQFLLNHDADPALKDHRGYNALHTAVENQYRDICKILIDHDPDLLETTTKSGETIEELANKQTFSQWIGQELKNL